MTTLLIILILGCAFYGITLTIKADQLADNIPEGLLHNHHEWNKLLKKAVSLCLITFILVVILAISI